MLGSLVSLLSFLLESRYIYTWNECVDDTECDLVIIQTGSSPEFAVILGSV
jgi:hypothetical protein